jgi:MFS family permease
MISLLLFAIPGILLGAVSPAAVRFYSLTLKDTHVGAAAGTISMLGSLGSFVGTFLSGFFLLSTFGVRSIFFGTAALLLVLAVRLLSWPKTRSNSSSR